MASNENVLSPELKRALAIARELPHHRSADQEGYYYTTVSPTRALMEQTNAELNRARYLVRKLTEFGYVGFIRHGGDKLDNGRRGHAWLVKAPEEPAGGNGEVQLALAAEPAKPAWLRELQNAVHETVLTLSAAVEEIEKIGREGEEQKARVKTLEAELGIAIGERDQASEEAGRLSDRLKSLQALLNEG